jgi:hypothetical protein
MPVTELLRIVERLSALEATADHARAIWRTVEKRLELGDGRMDRTDLALSEIRGTQQTSLAELRGTLLKDLAEVRTQVQSREQDDRRRQAFRGDAIKGGLLLLSGVAFVGALLGKVPWSTFDIFAGGLVK